MLFNKITILVIFSIIYMISLAAIYLSKERIRNKENRIYLELIFVNIFGLFMQLFLEVVTRNVNILPTFFVSLILKVYSAHFIVYLSLITKYMFTISTDKYFKIIDNLRKIYFYTSIIVILFLPVKLFFNPENLDAYSYGVGIDFTFLISFITDIFLVGYVVIRRKSITMKKCIPLIIFVIFGTICGYIQQQSPSITLIGCAESFICFLMYFTIENPDLILIEELTKAQKLSERTNNDKSNFIYTVSEDIQNRLNNAEKVYNNVMELNPNEDISYEMENLKNVITGARNMLNSALGISNDDNKHLGLTNNKYNINLLLNSIYLSLKQNVKENIDFRLNVTDDLPKELYGDSIKIKQIISSILDNSIKYTEKGFIELRVNSILKNDICRLIISIEDSGKGIDIFKQNEIMSSNEDLTEEEIKTLENKTLNLKIVRKMISIIGGTFTIDNNKYGGTTINISLDQRIVENNQSKEEKEIAKYSENLKNQKTCAIISMDKDSIKAIKNASKKLNFKVFEFAVCKDALDNIRNNVNYDVVFIDEFMEKIDARSFLNKVREVETFAGNIIVITKYKDIKTKKELLDLGFNNIVNIPLDKKDIINKLENL